MRAGDGREVEERAAFNQKVCVLDHADEARDRALLPLLGERCDVQVSQGKAAAVERSKQSVAACRNERLLKPTFPMLIPSL